MPLTFHQHTLPNGLEVVAEINPDSYSFAGGLFVKTGSRDEDAKVNGVSHFLEHMMFKGSENVGAGEHFYSVFSNGGTMNGTTNKERTLYYEALPSNQLDMALFLEADRMRSLAIDGANLDNQRQAVKEERRLRLDNQPYGRTFEAFDELAFDNFANQHSVIGSMADLDAASVADVASFFKTYYAPNNATVTIVGDVNTTATIERVHKYFDAIPAQPAPPAVDASEQPRTGERRQAIDDPLARLARLDIGYQLPSSLSPDDDAIDLTANILAAGRSARLYEGLVRQKQLALSVAAFAENSRGPRLLHVIATVAPDKSAQDAEAALYAEIDRLKTGAIADWEIEKSRNIVRSQLVASMGSSLSRASLLAELTLLHGDPGRINALYNRVAKLTASDVRRVATQYLIPEHRAVIVTTPKSAAPSKGAR